MFHGERFWRRWFIPLLVIGLVAWALFAE